MPRINLYFVFGLLILSNYYSKSEFVWNDCGDKSDPLRFNEVHVSPVPVIVNGELIINGTITLDRPVTDSIKMELEVFRKIATVPIKIMCIGNYGSCTYPDICTFAPDKCPPNFEELNVPCHCPLPQGRFNVPNYPVNLRINMPSIFNGKYAVTAVLSDKISKLGCIDFNVDVVNK